jgi:hypothetical protein
VARSIVSFWATEVLRSIEVAMIVHESTEMKDLKVGEIVHLKSGSPDLRVTSGLYQLIVY